MRKTVIIICMFCVFLLGLTGCSDKKNGSEVSADKYVYDCDIELKNIDSGYVNYDCILTREWVMEYASYINDSATGYDYDLFITYANGERKTITRACESGEAVLGIGYVNESDSFYIDPATRVTRFDTEEFERMLSFLEKYSPKNESVEYFKGLEEGEVVFNLIGINTPKDLFFLDEMSKSGINIVELPKGDGAYNELCTSHALMLRSSASEEEKEIAFEFFKMLLSKEVQMKMIQSPNFHFSVRDDVINEQIRAIKDGDYISLSFFGTGNEFFITNPPYEEISALWEEILSDSVSNIITDEGYEEILAEEFEDYFDGRITKELLISHLKNRVDLYLAEHDD